MKTCSRSPLALLWFIYIRISVLEAQEVKVQPEVTGYLGHNVTLPCQFIPGTKNTPITQVQWELQPPEGEKIIIIVFNAYFGVSLLDTFLKERVKIAEHSLIIRDVEMRDAGSYTCSIATYPSGSFEGTINLVVQVSAPDTFLKERVKIAEQSLIIRDVEMRDAGSYTCRITTFPSGSFDGTTNLVVQEQISKQMLLILLRTVAAEVFVLIVVTMFTITYFIIIRIRRETAVKHHFCTDTVQVIQ